MLYTLLVVALIAIAWTAPAAAFDTLERWTSAPAADLLRAHNDPTGRAVATTLLAASAALAFALAWGRATRPDRPVRLADGRGTMAVEAVADELRAVLVCRPDVQSAEVTVRNRHRRGVAVAVQLAVAPHARLTATIEGTHAAAEALICNRLGLSMAAPAAVDLRYDELDLRPARR